MAQFAFLTPPTPCNVRSEPRHRKKPKLEADMGGAASPLLLKNTTEPPPALFRQPYLPQGPQLAGFAVADMAMAATVIDAHLLFSAIQYHRRGKQKKASRGGVTCGELSSSPVAKATSALPWRGASPAGTTCHVVFPQNKRSLDRLQLCELS